MNPGQTMFYDFFIKIAQETKIEQAKTLLADCFAKQDNGTFDRAYLEAVKPQFYEVVRPEAVSALDDAMANFAARLN